MCSEALGGEGRLAVGKFIRAVTIKISVEVSYRSNSAAVFERLKTVSPRRRVDGTGHF